MVSEPVTSSEMAQRAYQVWEGDNKLLDEMASRLGYEKIVDRKIVVGTKVGMVDDNHRIIRIWERRDDGEWYCTDRSGYRKASLARVLPDSFVWPGSTTAAIRREAKTKGQGISKLSLEELEKKKHELRVKQLRFHWGATGELYRVIKEIKRRETVAKNTDLEARMVADTTAKIAQGGYTCKECGSLIRSFMKKPEGFGGTYHYYSVCEQGHETLNPNEMQGGVLITCPFCHKFVIPERVSTKNSSTLYGVASWKPLIGLGSTTSRYNQCPNCQMNLGPAV